MKVKALLFVATLALLGASIAVAAPPADKGKPAATGAGCKPGIAVVLRGTLAGNGAAAPLTVQLTVSGGNHYAAAFKKAAQPLSIQITASTKVNRQGDRNPADLKSGDRVRIQAKACRADLANGATPSLTAARVDAHPVSA